MAFLNKLPRLQPETNNYLHVYWWACFQCWRPQWSEKMSRSVIEFHCGEGGQWSRPRQNHWFWALAANMQMTVRRNIEHG